MVKNMHFQFFFWTLETIETSLFQPTIHEKKSFFQKRFKIRYTISFAPSSVPILDHIVILHYLLDFPVHHVDRFFLVDQFLPGTIKDIQIRKR